jgi:hypothetical protein
MASSEVQRTLVKSPPELWAELGNPTSLARHLGDFGEIRTTRIEPETTVEWEADAARGTVQLKPSGWGTKVTLTVVRDTPEVEEEPPTALEPEPAAAAVEEPPASVAAAVEEPPASAAATVEELPASATTVEELPQPEPGERRPRFLARLFRRRRRAQAVEPEQQPETDLSEVTDPVQPERVAIDEPALLQAPEQAPDLTANGLPNPALDDPHPALDDLPEPGVDTPPDLATELAQVEQAMAEQDAALLAAVLDRLGAAHHRPFSRG